MAVDFEKVVKATHLKIPRTSFPACDHPYTSSEVEAWIAFFGAGWVEIIHSFSYMNLVFCTSFLRVHGIILFRWSGEVERGGNSSQMFI